MSSNENQSSLPSLMAVQMLEYMLYNSEDLDIVDHSVDT